MYVCMYGTRVQILTQLLATEDATEVSHTRVPQMQGRAATAEVHACTADVHACNRTEAARTSAHHLLLLIRRRAHCVLLLLLLLLLLPRRLGSE